MKVFVFALLCVCVQGAPDTDHGSPLGVAKAVDNDGSMKGMYVYTVQKIETLAEKLESLATKTVSCHFTLKPHLVYACMLTRYFAYPYVPFLST